MTKKELERNKVYSKLVLDTAIATKKILKTDPKVVQYLRELEIIDKEREYQAYLEKLEVSKNGVVFAPPEEQQTIMFKKTHFGLAETLGHAFNLIDFLTINESLNNTTDYYELSFPKFNEYITNARTILRDMNYVEGDRLVPNFYNVKVYENPKNYSIIDFQSLQPITMETLEASYNISNVTIKDNTFIVSKETLPLLPSRQLTPRENEAFYGEQAEKILSSKPTYAKVKRK